MTFRYEKLHKREKDLQQKLNTKIANDISNVQQVLKALVMQKQSQEMDFIVCNNNIFQETNGKEEREEELRNNHITNIDLKEKENKKENKKITDYKTNLDWHASLLMYNSY